MCSAQILKCLPKVSYRTKYYFNGNKIFENHRNEVLTRLVKAAREDSEN